MTEEYERDCCDRVDLKVFLIALFLAPVVIALLGFWLYLIPIFAVFMGMLPYILLGGPVVLLYLYLLPHIPLVPSMLLFCVNYALFSGEGHLAQMLFGYSQHDIAVRLQFGSLFAPLWGVAFECLYAAMRCNR